MSEPVKEPFNKGGLSLDEVFSNLELDGKRKLEAQQKRNQQRKAFQHESDDEYDEQTPEDYFQQMDTGYLQNMIHQLQANPDIDQLDPAMAKQLNIITNKFAEMQQYNPDIFVYDENGVHGEERLILGIDDKGAATELGKFTVINDEAKIAQM